MHDIYLALSGLTLVSKVNGKIIFLVPDALYQRFIEFSPLLPPKATTWSFSLVTLFYDVLSVEFQEVIRLDGYTLPNNSTLVSLSSQTSALQALRGKSVVAHKLLCEDKYQFLSILNSVSSRNAGINPMYSQAESTIRSHIPPSTQTQPLKSLVKGTDGKLYSKNPINNYVS